MALLLVIPAWSSLHFYCASISHWPPLYRIAHRLHHKNVNVGPWSGVSMHPIEHVLYYSSVLIHFVVPTTPLLFIYHVCYEHLSPPFSHSGFEKVVIRDRERLKAGDFFHQLPPPSFRVQLRHLGDALGRLVRQLRQRHDGKP